MAGLTKQHFNRIAEIIKKNTAPKGSQHKDLSIVGDCLREDLADYFKTQNPTFEKNRFIKACLE